MDKIREVRNTGNFLETAGRMLTIRSLLTNEMKFIFLVAIIFISAIGTFAHEARRHRA